MRRPCRYNSSLLFLLAAGLVFPCAAQVQTPEGEGEGASAGDPQVMTTVVTPDSPVSGRVGVVFELADPDSRTYQATVSYSVDGRPFEPATQGAGSGGLSALTSAPNGRIHVFVWDVLADLGNVRSTNVRLRFEVRSAVGAAPFSAMSDPFAVDTRALLSRVEGAVTSAATGEPVSGAAVELQQDGQAVATTTTGGGGNYALNPGTLGAPLDLVVRCENKGAIPCQGFDPVVIRGIRPPLRLPIRLVPAAPAAPTGLVAFAAADEAQLRWRANPEADLAGFHVYRSLDGGPFQRVTEEPVANNVFEDEDVRVERDEPEGEEDKSATNGGPMPGVRYRVTAVDTSGNESNPSATAETLTEEIVVSLPDVAVVPGDFARIPINVANASGISMNGLDIELQFEPNFFTEARVERTGVTGQVGFEANETLVETEGRVRISGIGSTVLRGEGHLFDVFLETPEEAPLGAMKEIKLTNVALFDEAPERLSVNFDDTGTVELVSDCIEGDLNNDGVVTPEDGELALGIAVGRFQPDDCQRQASDLNGDGRIDSADATLILRLAAGRPLNPGRGKGRTGTKQLDVTVTVGTVEGAQPGEIVEVPVSVDDATGISAFDISLGYPEQRPNLVFQDILAGALTSGFTFEQLVTDSGVVVSASRDVALTGGSGAIARLQFRVAGTAPFGADFPVQISSIEFKGQHGESFQWFGDTQFTGGAIKTSSAILPSFITVTVVDDATGTPLTNATVTASPGFWEGNHQGEGVYTFEGLDGGHTFRACAPGFTQEAAFRDVSGTVEVPFRLDPTPDSPCGDSSASVLLREFFALDTNKDGMLSKSEAQGGVPSLSDGGFEAADSNGNGMLTLGELYQAAPGESALVADSNGNGVLSLGELLRLIQLYNAGDYSCANPPGATEDGYLANDAGSQSCRPHTADFQIQDWSLSLSEILRMIQVFTLRGYEFCPEIGDEDDFCAGAGCCITG